MHNFKKWSDVYYTMTYVKCSDTMALSIKSYRHVVGIHSETRSTKKSGTIVINILFFIFCNFAPTIGRQSYFTMTNDINMLAPQDGNHCVQNKVTVTLCTTTQTKNRKVAPALWSKCRRNVSRNEPDLASSQSRSPSDMSSSYRRVEQCDQSMLTRFQPSEHCQKHGCPVLSAEHDSLLHAVVFYPFSVVTIIINMTIMTMRCILMWHTPLVKWLKGKKLNVKA